MYWTTVPRQRGEGSRRWNGMRGRISPKVMATTIRNELEPIPTDWSLPRGGLYFVTSKSRAGPERSPPWRSWEYLPGAESVSYAERSNIPNNGRSGVPAPSTASSIVREFTGAGSILS
jgi:hypothetical protein